MGKSGGGSCSVAVCRSPAGVAYHSFPKGAKDTERLALWIAACHRRDTINIKTARICQNHFREDDYERDLRNELLNLPTRKLLKPTAVPSVNLIPDGIVELDGDNNLFKEDSNPSRAKRSRKRKIKTESSHQVHNLAAVEVEVQEDSDIELYEAEFELNDQSFIKKEFVWMRSRIKFLEQKLQQQSKELTELRNFKKQRMSSYNN